MRIVTPRGPILVAAALLVAFTEFARADDVVALDLNGDNVNDASLSFEDCGDATGRHCLIATSALFSTPHAVAIDDPSARPAHSSPETILADEFIRQIGDHSGDGIREIALLYVRQLPDGTFAPAMAIVDIGLETVLGNVTSPPELSTFDNYTLRADALFPRGPGGLFYPALMPGYGDSNSAVGKRWGWGCLFRLGAASSDCGPGFLRIAAEPQSLPYGATLWFREAFGHVADIDDDGWEDLHLPYHAAFLSISGRTGLSLTTTSYDVAATTGAQPLMFHSGRNYGVHHTVVSPSGGSPVKRTVLVAGSRVGDFDDPFCNVSRYVGVLKQDGSPATRALAWARFEGFHSNNWTSWPWVEPGGEAPQPSRWGDFADNCIHRYADARTVMNGEEVVLVNYFRTDWTHPDNSPLASRCKNEQYQLYLEPAWTDAKQAVWMDCARSHLATKGHWGTKVLRESDGAVLTGSVDTYVWGWSNALRADGETLYLVERLPAPVRFDARGSDGNRLPALKLQVLALVDGLWVERGAFPIAGRPVLLDMKREGGLGTGDFYGANGLSLADVDADGLADVGVAAGPTSVVWVGWSSLTNSWISKAAPSGFRPPTAVTPPATSVAQVPSRVSQQAPALCIRPSEASFKLGALSSASNIGRTLIKWSREIARL